MSDAETKSIQLEERRKAEELLYAQIFHGAETKTKAIALGIAFVLHVVVLLVNFPEFKKIEQRKPENVIVVKKYVPPPPKIERKQIVKKKFTRKVPIPDPTPDEPEPIREPEPEIEPEPIPPDVDVLIGVPEPPPASGPLLAGAEGVTLPKLIQASKVKPDYPELARVARIEGRVILQAIVLKDGTVGELEILSCNRPNMGFEEAAVSAVAQWRYEPAMQGSKPVDVYFTVRVDFELQ
jgi:protein TonB